MHLNRINRAALAVLAAFALSPRENNAGEVRRASRPERGLPGQPPVVRLAARLFTACLMPCLLLIALPGMAWATTAAPAPDAITGCADLPLGQGAAVHNAALADAADLRQAEPSTIQAGEGGTTENPQFPCGALIHVEDALGRYVLVVGHSAVSGVASYAMLSYASPTSYAISGAEISFSDASSTPEIVRYASGTGDDSSISASLGPDAQVCTLAFGAAIAVLMQFVTTCGPLGPTLLGAACALGAFGAGTVIGVVVCSGPGVQNIHNYITGNDAGPTVTDEYYQDGGLTLDMADWHWLTAKGLCIATERSQCFALSPSRNTFVPSTVRWATSTYVPYVHTNKAYSVTSRAPQTTTVTGGSYSTSRAPAPGSYTVQARLLEISVCPDNERVSVTHPSGCSFATGGGTVRRHYSYQILIT